MSKQNRVRSEKRRAYFAPCEELYVEKGHTIQELAKKYRLSENTLNTWKREGDWEVKREKFIGDKQAFSAEIFEFSRELMRDIKKDLANEITVHPTRYTLLKTMLSVLPHVKEIESEEIPDETSENDTDKINMTIDRLANKSLGR